MPRGRGLHIGGTTLMVMFIVAVFLLFNMAPQLLGQYLPQLYYAPPCTNLRVSSDRANHQSLIGVGAPNPLALSVTPSTLPATADGFFSVRITLTNTSNGTVPILIDPLNVTVNGTGGDGLGLRFNPANSLTSVVTSGAVAPANGFYVLGPRQSCVQLIVFPAGNVLVDPTIAAGRTTVQAYYRNSNPGTVVQPSNTLATPIFRSAGLWVGTVESPPVVIPIGGASF